MTSAEEQHLSRMFDALIMALILMVFVIAFSLAQFIGFVVRWETFKMPAFVGMLCFIGSVIYSTVRYDVRIASAMKGSAQFIVFTLVGAPLSYIAASSAMPIQDAAFATFDASIGFDWVALLRLMDRWSDIQPLFYLPYASMLPQIAVLTLLLAFTNRHLDIRRFLFAFALAAIVTIAVSAAVPSFGPWHHYNVDQLGLRLQSAVMATHVPVVEGLRDGSIRDLVGVGAIGIISMPSLHAASAILLILAAWKIPGVRWFYFLLNLLMLFATLIEGAHYLSDVIAGIAIAFLCHWASCAVATHLARPVRLELAAGAA